MPKQSARATDIDRHVGARIRERRIMLGLSQGDLGRLIGVTYQQQAKRERGINRVSASALVETARALHVPVSYFFDGIEGPQPQPANDRERLTIELVRSFGRLTPPLQDVAVQVVHTLAGGARP